MNPEFWHRKWAANEIGFHESAVNPLLVKHFAALSLAPGSRIFVPLCGKTLDIHWLLSSGYRVVGVELSGVAVDQLFAELECEPSVSVEAAFECRSVPELDVFVGDFFALTTAMLGKVDAVYDRAALVAMPPELRGRYAGQVAALSGAARQLLVSFDYDQSLMAGPPFSVPADEVARHYGQSYRVTPLDSVEIPGGFRGRVPAREDVWLLEA